jgi:hypothetical protein
MLLDHDVKSLDQVRLDAPMNTTRATGQSRMFVPPLRVVRLNDTRLATALLTGNMLLGTETPGIGIPEIRRDQFVSVVLRNVAPSQLQHLLGSSSNRKSKNMFDGAGDSNPEPKRGGFSDAKFVELDRVFQRSRMRRQALLLYTSCVFLRIERTVLRLTLKVWAMPTWEILCPRARTMAASFSGVRERELGLGVKMRRHDLHRHRSVLLSFLP